MANRRMFSLDVIDTDLFLEMPATSQNLYFHLGMRADDDGFVSSPKKITKSVNCGQDDLNILIARGFLIPFDDGVVVIRHWKQNNRIRSDRYKETIYQADLAMLTDDNGVYELDTNGIPMVHQTDTNGIPMVQNWDTQYRLGKDSLVEDSIGKGSKGEVRGGKTPDSLTLFDDLSSHYGFSDDMTAKIRSWVKYKSERKESYKEQGMKSLLKQIQKHIDESGEDAVCDLIDDCMANGWKGIIWDRLEQAKPKQQSIADKWMDALKQAEGG